MMDMQILMGLAAFFVMASLKGTLLAALVLFIQRAARRYLSAATRYLLWFPVVIALLTPVGLELAVPAALLSRTAAPVATPPVPTYTTIETSPRPPATEPSNLRSQEPASAQSSITMPLEAVPPPSRRALAWPAALAGLWLAGVLTVLGAIAVSCVRFRRSVRRARPITGALQQLLAECMAQTSCTRQVRIMESAGTQVPMIAGLLRPVLLLPAGIGQQLSREQLRHVFVHELMHLQRGDIAGNWLIALVQALHWFNPVVWFAFFRMRLDRELACDAATLKHLAPSDRARYGRTLLLLNDSLVQRPLPALALGMLDSSSDLPGRIMMLVQSPHYRKLQTLVAAVLFVPLAAAAFSQPVPRTAEPADAPAFATAVSNGAPPPAASAAVAAPVTPVAEQAREPASPQPPADVGNRESVSATSSTAVAQVPETAAAVPVRRERRSLAPATPDTALLAQAAAATPLPAAPFTTPVAERTVAAAPTSPPPSAEPSADLPAIEELAGIIASTRAVGIDFIKGVEAAVAECEARGDGFFSVFTAPCTKKRAALRNGDIFYFGYHCYLLQARRDELEQRHREAAPAQAGRDEAARLLREAEANLADFCSKETYATEYPVFAAMFADAQSLKYFRPGMRAPDWAPGVTTERWYEHTRDWGDHLFGASIGNLNSAENWGAVASTPPAFSGGMDGGGAPVPSTPQ